MTATAPSIDGTRPMALLPWKQLGLISVYWLGINAVWGGYEWFGQAQVELMVGQGSRGLTIGLIEAIGGLIPILVVPTAGVISDYTTSRFGKRKGYIITGSFLDLLFIAGLALIAMAKPAEWDGQALGTPTLIVVYALLFWGLQFGSNVAQGPYQGFVPDLVAEAWLTKAQKRLILKCCRVVCGQLQKNMQRNPMCLSKLTLKKNQRSLNPRPKFLQSTQSLTLRSTMALQPDRNLTPRLRRFLQKRPLRYWKQRMQLWQVWRPTEPILHRWLSCNDICTR